MTVGISLPDTRVAGWTTIPFRSRIQKGYHQPVRVPDFVTKAVGFIGEWHHRGSDSGGQMGDMYGTGFFVSVPSSAHGSYLYLVTARHVAEGLKDNDVCITVNKRGGGVMEIFAVEPALWFLHPTDTTCDVAVTQVVHIGDADLIAVPYEELLTPEEARRFDVGIGDEVFATGLFSEIPNTTRNLPILRHGNISMMPGEQIQTELGYADVCLVEARSLGGLSGSPVFVRPTANVGAFLALTTKVKLLGLMHGHWDVKESELNNPRLNHDRKHGVNYGVAIVTPAIKIIETIDRPELKEIRMRNDERLKKRNVPEMDSAKPRTDKHEPLTQADFESALTKATRKVEAKKH